MSAIVQLLFENYQQEKIDMTYTVQDFQKDYVLDHLNLLSPDEVLKRYSPEMILKNYSPDQRLKDLSPDEILSSLSPENLKILIEKMGKQ